MWPEKYKIPESHKLLTSNQTYIWEVTIFKAHLQFNLDWKSVYKKNIQVYIFQVQSRCDLKFNTYLSPTRRLQIKLLGKQKPNMNSAQLNKSFQKKFSEQRETSLEQEPDVDQEVIISPPQAATSIFIHILRVLKWAGLSMIVCIIDSSSGRSNVKTS